MSQHYPQRLLPILRLRTVAGWACPQVGSDGDLQRRFPSAFTVRLLTP